MHTALILSFALSAAPNLPLKTVVLYENGVGYFERRGALQHGATAQIALEPGQLDDVLKSLVVRSKEGVASVEFSPSISGEAARERAGLPEDEASLSTLCRSLAGVNVEVRKRGGTPLHGRVIDVSEEALGKVDKEGKPVIEPALLLYGVQGVARISLEAIDSVQPLESQVASAWNTAVSARARQPEPSRLVVKGHGEVAVGYTTEAPVWKTTYRLVLGDKPARLQGFALIHNDSDENWNGVRVTLASGRPTSFLFPLAGPSYDRRELVSPQDGLHPVPQLVTQEAREHLRGEAEMSHLSAVAGVGVGGFGTSGYGAGGGGARGTSVPVGISSTILEDGPTPLEPAAVSEAGDLFLYTVQHPVILGARRSALLPILDDTTKAERISVVDAEGQAYTGVRIENTTPLTLEKGTLTVFSDGAYSGETQVDRLKPREVRVLKHGEDVDLLVTRRATREEGALRNARVVGNEGARVLEVTRVDRLVHQIEVTSRADVLRTVLVELTGEKYQLVGGGEEDVRSPGQPRFGRLRVAPHSAATFELREEGAVIERIDANRVTSARLEQLARHALAAETKQFILSLKAEIARAEAAQTKIGMLEARTKAIETESARIRENLVAVGKTNAVAAAQAMGQQLLSLEDELRAVRKERELLNPVNAEVRKTLGQTSQ